MKPKRSALRIRVLRKRRVAAVGVRVTRCERAAIDGKEPKRLFGLVGVGSHLLKLLIKRCLVSAPHHARAPIRRGPCHQGRGLHGGRRCLLGRLRCAMRPAAETIARSLPTYGHEYARTGGRDGAPQAATSTRALTMSSTMVSIRTLSSPSPMTRMTGSVPDGRMTSRP